MPLPKSATAKDEWKVRSRAPAETERIGQLAGSASRGGNVFALSGELGSGKTCFVRGLAAGLGATRLSVSSPTFAFVHEYQGRLRLAHVDLFRLTSPAAAQELGLSEYLDPRIVMAVEWPEVCLQDLPKDRLDVRFISRGKTGRELWFRSRGRTSAALLTRLRKLADQRAAHTLRRRPRTNRKVNPR